MNASSLMPQRYVAKVLSGETQKLNLTSDICITTAKGFSKTSSRLLSGITKQPSKVTQKLNTVSAICINSAKGCHRTIPRQLAGTEKLPIKVTQKLRPT